MEKKKIEVEKLPDGCRGDFFRGYKGCRYITVDPNPNNPGCYCRFDEKRTNLIFFAGERHHDCPLVQKQS